MDESLFNKRIKPVLKYIGAIGAILTSIAYILTIFVLIQGFNADKDIVQNITFAIVSAFVGILIMQCLKLQGVDFARSQHQELEEQYYGTKTKDKKVHSITYFWVTSVIKDILIKGLTTIASTVGVIYIVIQGSKDYNLLLLAIVNLVLFISFGLLSLVKAYDFYNNYHVAYMKEQLKERNNDNI